MAQPDPEDLERAAELFKVLAAPLRLGVVAELAAGERCVHELVGALNAPQPLISQHLRVLRAARLVRGSRRGREVTYRLVDEHVAHVALDAIHHVREPHAVTADPPRTGSRPRQSQPRRPQSRPQPEEAPR